MSNGEVLPAEGPELLQVAQGPQGPPNVSNGSANTVTAQLVPVSAPAVAPPPPLTTPILPAPAAHTAAALHGAAHVGKKRKRIRRMTEDKASVIRSVYNYFVEERNEGKPKVKMTRVLERTAAAAGVGTATVHKVVNRPADNPYPAAEEPETRKRALTVSPQMFGKLRQLIMQLYQKGKPLTLNACLSEMVTSPLFNQQHQWNFSRTTLHRTLARMGWVLSSPKADREGAKERYRVAIERTEFLRALQGVRERGLPIYYEAEHWFNVSIRNHEVHIVTEADKDATLSHAGHRVAVCQLGCRETGLVGGLGLCYRAKQRNAEFHGEMTGDMFLRWITAVVGPGLYSHHPEGCVLVLNQASYHMHVTPETRPCTVTSKAQRIEWLLNLSAAGGPVFNREDLNSKVLVELVHLCNQHAPTPEYNIVRELEKFNVRVLFLPKNHPELNPFSMMWPQLSGNRSCGEPSAVGALDRLESITQQIVSEKGNVELWIKHDDECRALEKQYLEFADREDAFISDIPEENENFEVSCL